MQQTNVSPFVLVKSPKEGGGGRSPTLHIDKVVKGSRVGRFLALLTSKITEEGAVHFIVFAIWENTNQKIVVDYFII